MATGPERRDAVIQHLASQGRAKVDALASHFHVSTVTMRNDLKLLEEAGFVARLHGAVILSQHTAAEIAFTERRHKNADNKQSIGAAAAAMVDNGDALILDAGTTTLEIARQLTDRENLLVMTNGLDIATMLAPAPGVEILMLGGQIRKAALSSSGAQAEMSLSKHRFDKLFLGVDALDLKRGLTTPHESEARLNRSMIEVADTVITVADSHKFGLKTVHLVSTLDQLDQLVTDADIPQATVDTLGQQHGIEVTVA
ncbi:DeoR family transcriptional regulator [Salinisphaera sp. USBA-960]|uniref:transcriptional repressor AgaR n=1 Tax=Salinisphaera orenii TaxID=856731 RepID=UPI000DBE70D7|nr:DeoR family transcriptional regulator [Salifodinibacter halophilus]NNC26128.1 DeoR family transcriptional regulator [Salifodinibacter halophilus]